MVQDEPDDIGPVSDGGPAASMSDIGAFLFGLAADMSRAMAIAYRPSDHGEERDRCTDGK